MTTEPADQIVPTPGSLRPGTVGVRLVCSPEVMDAALEFLADMFGDAWQPPTGKRHRFGRDQVLQFGILTVPVPRTTT